MKKYLPILGILLLATAGIWRFVIAPQSEQRFPDGYSFEVNSLGLTGYADEETGLFPETPLADDPINLTVRQINVTTEGAPAGSVLVSDHFETRDPVTDEITWAFTTETVIDPVTGQYVEGDLAGDYYFPPHNLDKNETYVISNSSYVSLPMEFQREEEVAGLNTYVYGYYGSIDSTAAYEGFAEVEEGQVITCVDMTLEYWAEPVTGEIVKYREACEGDWVIDEASGERLYGISRWGGENTGDDLLRRARVVNAQLNTYNMNNLYIPGALALLGIAVLAFGFFSRDEKIAQKSQ